MSRVEVLQKSVNVWAGKVYGGGCSKIRVLKDDSDNICFLNQYIAYMVFIYRAKSCLSSYKAIVSIGCSKHLSQELGS
jgi:hypothetical protein